MRKKTLCSTSFETNHKFDEHFIVAINNIRLQKKRKFAVVAQGPVLCTLFIVVNKTEMTYNCL